jgi:hypothetical protein
MGLGQSGVILTLSDVWSLIWKPHTHCYLAAKESKLNRYKIDFNAMDWDTPAAGVRQKLVGQNDRQLRLLEFS